MTKRFLVTVGVIGAVTVLLGAIGNHLLRDNVSSYDYNLFNLAGTYAIYHTLALLGLSFTSRNLKRPLLNTIYYFFVIGIVFFSGSLYVLSINNILGLDLSIASRLTPIGGIMLVLGWVFIIIAGFSYKHKKRH